MANNVFKLQIDPILVVPDVCCKMTINSLLHSNWVFLVFLNFRSFLMFRSIKLCVGSNKFHVDDLSHILHDVAYFAYYAKWVTKVIFHSLIFRVIWHFCISWWNKCITDYKTINKAVKVLPRCLVNQMTSSGHFSSWNYDAVWIRVEKRSLFHKEDHKYLKISRDNK